MRRLIDVYLDDQSSTGRIRRSWPSPPTTQVRKSDPLPQMGGGSGLVPVSVLQYGRAPDRRPERSICQPISTNTTSPIA
jgi:hypothetical protein